MKEKFEEAVDRITEALVDSGGVYAQWFADNGELSFKVVIKRVGVTHQEQDGWHLVGWDADGKQYCLGGATIVTASDEELYKP